MMVRPLQADNALADRLQISGFLLKSDYPISFDFIVSRTIRLSIRTSTARRTGCAALANFGAIKNKPLTAGCKDTDPLGRDWPLKFENGTVHGIRSVSQRALAASWARLCDAGLPSFDAFDPEPGTHDPKQLVAWKVETTGAQMSFRALYRGRLVDEAFNDAWTGKTLREVTPPSLQPAIIGASEHCVSTGYAIYTILRTYGAAGFPIELERLLLPFGRNGRVKIIVASLQLVSLQGTVERCEVAKNFEAQSEAVLSIRISAASINKSRSKAILAGDVVF
jgi:hypothetical protein